jgi:hypothetical protein
MSPASYLTAPPRVAASSIAPSRYDRRMSAVLWGAVAFCVFVVAATLAGLALLAWRGWRQFNAFRSGMLKALDELMESVDAVERRLAGVESKNSELQSAIARLSRSLAQARVLVAAAQEVGDLVGRVRGVVPTKSA